MIIMKKINEKIRHRDNFLKLLLILYLLHNYSCNESEDYTKNHSRNLNNYVYNKIIIETDFNEIEISNNGSCYIKYFEFHAKDGGGFIGDFRLIGDTTIVLSLKERDSIYSYVRSFFHQLKGYKRKTSCYVGNLKITLIIENSEYCCYFSSIGEWDKLDDNTRKIYNLLSSRVKIYNY